jgi:hypothetical protein
MQRCDEHIRAEGGLDKLPLDAPDLRHAGEKYQQTALVTSQGLTNAPDHCRFQMPVDRPVEILRGDGEQAAFAGDGVRILQQAGDRRAVEGRRHHKQAKVRSEEALRFPGEGQAKIRLQAAFVKFVEDDEAVSGE